MYRSWGRVIGEAILATALVAVIMAVAATGLDALFGSVHPVGHHWWAPTGAGLAVIFDPIAGAGVACGFWMAAVVVVGLLTRATSGLFRFWLGAGATVVVTALTLMIASVAALVQGASAVQPMAMTMVVMLLFLAVAVTALATVHLVIFRDRRPVHRHTRIREKSFTRAA